MSEVKQKLIFSAIKENNIKFMSLSIIDLRELLLKNNIKQLMLTKNYSRSLNKNYEESMSLTSDKTESSVDIDNKDIVYHY